MGPLALPKALLHLESPKGRNGKVKQRQMQSPDKKYQGVNRFCLFMPQIFAFLFLPWRHKPLLLSHNHLHCPCQEELQLAEGDPFPYITGYQLLEARQGACPSSAALKGITHGRTGFPAGWGDTRPPKGAVSIAPHGFELV